MRLSLTDRCDLACVYCRPSRRDGYASDRLGLSDFKALLDGLLRSGVRRVRFTGGEPLLSPHVAELVRYAAEQGAEDIALTTNGTRLEHWARELRAAGLERLTVSLDSLDEARFARLTRGGSLPRVLRGLEAALAAGFQELKLNCVVLRGENDDEIEALTRWAWERRIVPRFIEVMPIAEGAQLLDRLVPAHEILRRLAPLVLPEIPRVDPERGPAKYVRSRSDPSLRVGVITGATDTFCDGCDRLRVSSTGVLKPCLASDQGVDARGSLEARDPELLARDVARAWDLKPDGKQWRGCTEASAASVSMRSIGG